MKINIGKTKRNFGTISFKDRYQTKCSIQKSSLASEDAIWFGVDNANPQVMASDAKKVGVDTEETCGWVGYDIPKEVLLTTRMHLTQDQVIELLPILKHFANTGELPTELETI